jgi:hypothetical protein
VISADPVHLWAGLEAALAEVPTPDSVELKVLVAEDGNGVALAGMAAGQRAVRRRRLYLLDTPAGDLHRNGLVVRLRQCTDRRSDVVVKWRPDASVRPGAAELRRWRREFPHLRTELDVLPGAATWTAAISRDVRGCHLAAILGGDRPALLLSREQRRLIRTVAPEVDLGRLRSAGPVRAVRARLGAPDRRVAVEVWRFVDGREVLEVSTRCRPWCAAQAAAELAGVLARCGLSPARRQGLKTDLPVPSCC